MLVTPMVRTGGSGGSLVPVSRATYHTNIDEESGQGGQNQL